jgi:hypothetical protein
MPLSHKKAVPIWFVIGCLLTVYGALILGSGIYDYFVPANTSVAVPWLHLQVWWGLLVLALGLTYVILFHSGGDR